MNFIKVLIFVLFAAVQIIPQEKSIVSIESTKSSNTIPEYSNDAKIPLSLTPHVAPVDKIDPLRTELDYKMLAGVGAATIGMGYFIHRYQQQAWWTNQSRKFRFQNDPTYALGIDKAGHFFGGALLAHAFSGALEAANMQSEPAAIWGTSLSILFEMYVEIYDGFGPEWGFSPGDAIADVLGAGFTLSQYYFPFMKNFQAKVSYYPSQKMRDGLHKGNAIDDYEGQKYWLSVRVRNFLPKEAAEIWPEWLNIAGGVGIRNMDGAGGGSRDFYLALDLDAEAIPLYGGVWQFVKNTLNYIHFPMPAVRFGKDSAFFVFMF
ncbi:MAG: DUF2279 domain-containing protein [Ignavibacteriaceae bacterium]